jgi:hypothetical protein
MKIVETVVNTKPVTYWRESPRPANDTWVLENRGFYMAIIKTHQNGESTQNKFGGYNAYAIGQPKYIMSKWKKLKRSFQSV